MSQRTKRGKKGTVQTRTPTMPKSTTKKGIVRQQSTAAFFAEHRQIAGFENDGKSMYVAVREFVENGLDAAEDRGVCPSIRIEIKHVPRAMFLKKVGMAPSVVLAAPSQAHPTPVPVPVPLQSLSSSSLTEFATEATDDLEPILDDDSGMGMSVSEVSQDDGSVPSSSTPRRVKDGRRSGSRAKEVYRVKVRDNGMGMPHKEIPNMLGKVLSGTKQGIRQSRGKYGLGAKMVLIWAKQCTGIPIKIRTATSSSFISKCCLDIDLDTNEPKIIEHIREINPDGWIGTEITSYIHGNWMSHGRFVKKYVQTMAVITPYADFSLKYIGNGNGKDLLSEYFKRTAKIPPVPEEVPIHPSALNLSMLEGMTSVEFESTTFEQFVLHRFASTTSKTVDSLLDILSSVARTDKVSECLRTKNQMRQLVDAFHRVDVPVPDGKCLSTVGEYNLYLGVLKEVNPSLVATHASAPGVCDGHPFIVEAAVCLGGNGIQEGLNVFRFANKIPLLMDGGSDVMTKAAKDFKWSNYHIKVKTDRIGVFVSIVSTKIPFKGTGKETVSSDMTMLYDFVKDSLKGCCLKLKRKLVAKERVNERAARRQVLSKYLPGIATALHGVLKRDRLGPNDELEEEDKSFSSGKKGKNKKRRKMDEETAQLDADIGRLVGASGPISEATIREKLIHFVDASVRDVHGVTLFEEHKGLKKAPDAGVGVKICTVPMLRKDCPVEDSDYFGKVRLLFSSHTTPS